MSNLKLLIKALYYYGEQRGFFYNYIWSRNTSSLITKLKSLQSRVSERRDVYALSSDIYLRDSEVFELLTLMTTDMKNEDPATRLTVQYIRENLKEYPYDYLMQLKRLDLFTEDNALHSKQVSPTAVQILEELEPAMVKKISKLCVYLFCFSDRDQKLHSELLLFTIKFLKEKNVFTERNLTWMLLFIYNLVSSQDIWNHARKKAFLKDKILPLVAAAYHDDWIAVCVEENLCFAMTKAYAILLPHMALLEDRKINVKELLLLLKEKQDPDIIAEQIPCLIQLDSDLVTVQHIHLLVSATAPSAEDLHALEKTPLPDKSYKKYLQTCTSWSSAKEFLNLLNQLKIYKETNVALISGNIVHILSCFTILKQKGLLDTPEHSDGLLSIVTKYEKHDDFLSELLKYADLKINVLAVKDYQNTSHHLLQAFRLFKTMTQPLFNILVSVKDSYTTASQLLQAAKTHPNLLGKEPLELIEKHPQDAEEILTLVVAMQDLHILDEEGFAIISRKLQERTSVEQLKAPGADSIFNKNGKVLDPPLRKSYGM